MAAIELPDDIRAQLKPKAAQGPTLEAWLWKLAGSGTGSMAALDWSGCAAVDRVPGKVSGAWVLKGTRIPFLATFESLEVGSSIRRHHGMV